MSAVYSGPLRRVMVAGSDCRGEFPRNRRTRRDAPGSVAAENDLGLVQSATPAANATTPRVKIVPFTTLGVGSGFYMKLTGWHTAVKDAAGVNQTMYLRLPSAVFLCHAGDIPGPDRPNKEQGVASGRPMEATDRFCHTITLVAGSLGVGHYEGDIVSLGPLWGEAAYVEMPLRGARPWQVEFCNTNGAGGEMNALWVPAYDC